MLNNSTNKIIFFFIDALCGSLVAIHLHQPEEFFMNQIDHHQLFFRPGVSPTSINQFFESPSRFWKYSSLNPNKERKEATPAMIFGRLVHCLALTPEAFDKEFAVQPVKTNELDTIDDMKGFLAERGVKLPSAAKKPDFLAAVQQFGGKTWQSTLDAFSATVGRKTIVTQDQLAVAQSMQDAMFRNGAVRQLIGNGFSESPFCWFPDGEDGLMKKCRLDYVRQGLVIEYKTDIAPSEQDFMRTIGSRGYHRQLAWQMEAAERLYGEKPRGAIIIAQDKEMHDDIAIYALGVNSLELGVKENAYAWAEINRRMKTQDWRAFKEEIVPIELPRWYEANNPLPVAA
jgi:hypothetical protein